MDKPEKLTTLSIQDEDKPSKKQKQNSILCVGHHSTQTTGGKDELNIVLCEIVNGHHDHHYTSPCISNRQN